ncbi:lipoxygenase 1 [Fusarium sporotrichioides]|uniref:Manganese lipoxygenase n=1 Tax=Fusarium sporotrichioides TaxID=5514 RepID=A0A395SG11_FUSSP|nr:lipoxygenase 1 [Fusarium sporotrichioides]
MSAVAGHVVPPRSKLDSILSSGLEHNIEHDPLEVWDKGVFLNELLKQGIALSTNEYGTLDGDLVADEGLKKGTYKGTRLALTEIYSILEDAAVSHFDKRGFEPIFPVQRDLDLKKRIYQWSDGSDGYPPHLKVDGNEESNLPADERQSNPGSARSEGVGQIFDMQETAFVAKIAQAVSFIIPKDIDHENTPYKGPTLADVEKYNKAQLPTSDCTNNGDTPIQNDLNKAADIMKGRNIGEYDDWYSDARFAQQHFSGVNPSTIETAPKDKIKAYIDEAQKQGLDKVKAILEDGKDILIQDYSYFREATGISDEQIFQNTVYELKGTTPTGKTTSRYAAASVVIFQLHHDGRLHPLAITLDYKGSLEKSITIFNQRLSPDDKGDIAEKDDWPWRYAKTVAQTADWARHEIATHLVDTHMIEEAIIVATNRTIPEGELLYEILSPHWFRTLSLNAAARKLLVPGVIARIAGFGPTSPSTDFKGNNAFKLVDWSYKNFNFQEKYIPNDLKKRGFDIKGDKSGKYKNYPYANDMYLLWGIIRNFVKTVIESQYTSDHAVQTDPYIGDWCKEIQTNGQIPSFPTITTVEELIDAVTMCIHTASPQHTAVNYLQDYYYSFVPSKPPALCTPLPKDLQTLQSYTEKDLTAALPIGTDDMKWKDWLLAAQLPELLSYKVQQDYNLITYAKSLYNVNKSRTITENTKFNCKAIKKAAADFYSHLKSAGVEFEKYSKGQTEGTVEYPVLQPETTAISILI